MLKNFSLLLVVLTSGKLIASDPVVHRLNYEDDALGATKPMKIPMQPEPPIGTVALRYQLQSDQAVVFNPVAELVDDALGGVVKPSTLPDEGDLGVSKPVIPKKKTENNGLPSVPPITQSDTPKEAKSNYKFLSYLALGVGAVGLFVVIIRSGIFSSARKK